ncbi:MAG: DNA polymerase III subunit delta' [Desulfobacterales bacterium]
MSGFDSIIDQDRPIRILTTLLQNGTIPHALLLTGIEGVGKENAAIAFAASCNCRGERDGHLSGQETIRAPDGRFTALDPMPTAPCGGCKACRKIESGNHPDIIRIEPSGAFIKIDQIRSLRQILAMKPYEARIRVVIISDAQAMNPQAGNALLKVLEEPPEKTILILLATQIADLLPTIVSRCQHIRFNPISRNNLESLLIRKYELPPQTAMIITPMANGSLSRALTMYRSGWIHRRNWLINELNSLSSMPLSRLLAFGEQISRDKDFLTEACDIMTSWYRDLIVGKFYPEKIVNQDLSDNVQQTAQKMDLAVLLSKIDIIQSTAQAMRVGTNLRLAMESMLLKLARV